MADKQMKLTLLFIVFVSTFVISPISVTSAGPELRFGQSGSFTILQVADMHYANGKTTWCKDVMASQFLGCSDVNTTAFLERMIAAEKPDLIVFTGTSFENKSVLNLYFLDSGDDSKVPVIHGYDWIKPSQQFWFERTSKQLQKEYMDKPEPQKGPAPGLVYFHIPVPKFASFDSSKYTGVRQEKISSPSVNSGFFTTMVAAGDFVGHDHVKDFCGKLTGIHLCYAGGVGYHAYGKSGWSRRTRVVLVQLDETDEGTWGDVKSIITWKRLDDERLTVMDGQVLWSKSSAGFRLKKHFDD